MQGSDRQGARRTLSSRVSDALRAQIEAGYYAPGDKLPTEPALIDRFGFSRTVIREAIAALRADGLVESRQGAGVFVIGPRQTDPALKLFTSETDKISDIIEELELRIAIEVEAAGLAFRYIPVISGQITAENVEDQAEALDALEGPVFAYCRSGARCTNLYGLIQQSKG